MRKLAVGVLLIALAATTAGCIQREGQLAVMLSTVGLGQQESLGVQQVNVEVVRVEAREADDQEFVILHDGSIVHELLALQGGRALLALADEIDEGSYDLVRIFLSSANSFVVNDAGRRQPLKIEGQTTLVPAFFTVVEDESLEVVLQVDIRSSLTLKANGTWVLRPVITQADDPL